ncbi:MAG: zinc-ribbon domain-containing protein [Ktedonobacteraceae bacterium]
MSFQAIIGTIASIVSIVGGVLGIISAVSKEPVFTRFWQHQSRTKLQPELKSSPSFSTPFERVTPSARPESQSRQMSPPSRLKPGIVFGLITGGLAFLILIGLQALYLMSYSPTYAFFAFIGLGMLSVVAGLLSSRTSGSLRSAVIAGGILGLFSFLAGVFSNFFLSTSSPSGSADYVLVSLVFLCVPAFIVSILFGLLGRYLHKKLQVPAPNENTSATVKQLSKNDAQQLQQAPHYARQSTPGQVKCPNCNATNSNGARFCNQCGTKLT